MKFIVCIKQVPDVASPLRLSDGEISVDAGRMILNAYDASALEAALVLTEEYGGSVHVVLVGPPTGTETIRKALAMGADAATHLKVEENDAAFDSRAYAQVLADFLSEADFDVVACGKQAQDTDAGLTGSMLGELLERPFTGNAVGLEVDGDALVVTRQGDAGQEIVEMDTPCVVSCSNDMNDPRIPNLKGIMAAKRIPIDTKPVTLPADVPRTRVRRYEDVPEREPGRMLEGGIDDAVNELVSLLKNSSQVL